MQFVWSSQVSWLGRKTLLGQLEPLPGQYSAGSHSEIDVRQRILLFLYKSVGQLLDTPSQNSARSQDR